MFCLKYFKRIQFANRFVIFIFCLFVFSLSIPLLLSLSLVRQKPARTTVHRSAYNKFLIDSYLRMISSDAPTYIGASPSPLIMSNQFDFISDRRCRSKSPPPRLPSSLAFGKLDYLYNGAAHNLQYSKKLRNRCDQMST